MANIVDEHGDEDPDRPPQGVAPLPPAPRTPTPTRYDNAPPPARVTQSLQETNIALQQAPQIEIQRDTGTDHASANGGWKKVFIPAVAILVMMASIIYLQQTPSKLVPFTNRGNLLSGELAQDDSYDFSKVSHDEKPPSLTPQEEVTSKNSRKKSEIKKEEQCIELLSIRGLARYDSSITVPIRTTQVGQFPVDKATAHRADRYTRAVLRSLQPHAMNALRKSRAIRNPYTKYIHPEKLSLLYHEQKQDWITFSHQNTKTYAAIYGLHQPGVGLKKIGFASRPSPRFETYKEDEDYELEDHHFSPIVMIQDLDVECDCKLSKQVEWILNKLINSPHISKQAKRYFKGILASPRPLGVKEDEYLNTPKLSKVAPELLVKDSSELYEYRHWGRGGIKNALFYGWIEFSTQIEFGMDKKASAMVEQYAFPQKKYNQLLVYGEDTYQNLLQHAKEIIGAQNFGGKVLVKMLGTWVPSHRPDFLYPSYIVMKDYILGQKRKKNHKNAINHPAIEWYEGITAEEIFSTSYPTTDIDDGDQVVCETLRDAAASSDQPALIFADRQNFMYLDLVEIQVMARMFGFQYVATLLGGEILVYRHGYVMLLIHGHLSIAADSRGKIQEERQQRRAVVIAAFRNLVRHVTGGDSDPIVGTVDSAEEEDTTVVTATDNHLDDTSIAEEELEFDDSAIFMGAVGEAIRFGTHGNLLFNAAVKRDILTPPEIDAVDNTKLSMSPKGVFHHLTRGKMGRQKRKELLKRYCYDSDKEDGNSGDSSDDDGNDSGDDDSDDSSDDDQEDSDNSDSSADVRKKCNRFYSRNQVINAISDTHDVDDDYDYDGITIERLCSILEDIKKRSPVAGYEERGEQNGAWNWWRKNVMNLVPIIAEGTPLLDHIRLCVEELKDIPFYDILSEVYQVRYKTDYDELRENMLSSNDGHYFFARKENERVSGGFEDDDVKTTRFKAFPDYPVFKLWLGKIKYYYNKSFPSKGFQVKIKKVTKGVFQKKFKGTYYDNQEDFYDKVGLYLYKGTMEAVEDESEL